MWSHVNLSVVVALLAGCAAAKTVRIDVGGKAGKVFEPDHVEVAKGDTVEFHFSKKKHSVVAGEYDKPCMPLEKDGFYSGTLQDKDDEPSVFRVMVNSTDPLFFYCSVGDHCQDGMVGAMNPTSEMTVEQYRGMAKSAGNNTSPPDMYGGSVVKAGDEADSTASASSSKSSPSSSSSSSSSSPSAGSSGASTHMGATVGLVGAAAAVLAAMLA